MQHHSVRTALAFLFLLLAVGYMAISGGLSWLHFEDEDTAVAASPQLISDISLWQRTRGEQALTTTYPLDLDHDLDNLPLTIGNWQGEDVEISDVNALILLEPEQIVERLYTNEQGQFLWLTLIGSRQSRSFHPPADCYFAAGWETETVVQTIPLADGEMQGMLISALKVDQEETIHARQLSYYFYLFPRAQRQADDGIVMFRLTAPVFGSQDETVQLFSSFMQHLFQGQDEVAQPGAYTTAVFQPTAAELQLLGYQLSHQTVAADDVVGVDVHWFVQERPKRPYQTILRARDETGLIWSENEVPHLFAFNVLPPTTEWIPGETIWDRRELSFLPGTPPGTYQITLSLVDLQSLMPITFISNNGEPVGPERLIGTLAVSSATEPITFHPSFPVETILPGVELFLQGSDPPLSQAMPGQAIPMTLYWWAQEQPGGAAEISLDLVSEQAQIVHSWQLPPVSSTYPPRVWQPGERLRGQHTIPLPSGLEEGRYAFAIAGVQVGELQVVASERLWETPVMETAVNATFANTITLAGYTLSENQLTLVWQAAAEIPESYHVFVHVVDDAGTLLTQSDGIPAHWQRPTTTWAAQEFIIDEHVLDLPTDQGGLSLRVGLYQPDTGSRLQSSEGEFIELKLPKNQ